MKPVLVQTSVGSVYVSPTDIVPIVGENPEEVLAAELHRYRGRTALFEKEGEDVGLDHIVQTMCEIEPRYKLMRDSVFTTKTFDEIQYEVTRLRYDLITAFSNNAKELFSEGEIENIENCLYHVDGMDFSPQTYNRLIKYLSGISKEIGIDHYNITFRSWLDGEVMHPRELNEAVQLAHAIKSEEFERRACAIRDSKTRDEHDYFKLVDFHATATSIFSTSKGKGEDKKEERGAVARVHEEYPVFYRELADVLGPMLERHVVEATIYDAKIPSKKERKGKHEEGFSLTRKLLSAPKEEVDSLYFSLKRTRQKSRSSVLEGMLDDWIDITEKAYLKCWVELSQPDITTIGTFDKVYQLIPFVRNGRIYVVSQSIAYLRFLSPMYNYDPEELIDIFDKQDDLYLTIKTRDQKKKLIKDLENCNMATMINKESIQKLYDGSVLFQSMQDFESFCREMTKITRAVDIHTLMNVPANLIERVTIKDPNDPINFLVRELGEKLVAESGDLKKIGLPPEIASINSFLTEINRVNDERAVFKGGSINVFKYVFDVYGLDFYKYQLKFSDLFCKFAEKAMTIIDFDRFGPIEPSDIQDPLRGIKIK